MKHFEVQRWFMHRYDDIICGGSWIIHEAILHIGAVVVVHVNVHFIQLTREIFDIFPVMTFSKVQS